MNNNKLIKILIIIELLRVFIYALSVVFNSEASVIVNETTKYIVFIVCIISLCVGVYSIYKDNLKLAEISINLIGAFWFMLFFIVIKNKLIPLSSILLVLGFQNIVLKIIISNIRKKE